MTQGIAERALAHWGLSGAELHLIAQRENHVYRVTTKAGGYFALRLHRPGYQTGNALRSELAWMQELVAKGIDAPKPIATTDGSLIIYAEGYHIDMLSWLSGTQMGATAAGLQLEDRQATFRALGTLMAKVHQISDDWQRPPDFERMAWDREGLLGEDPVWGRFWANPHLTEPQSELFNAVRTKANQELIEHGDKLDYGLIHADLVRENVLVSDTGLQLIDFDDSGFGFRLFDVCTTLLKNRDEPDFPTLQSAFVDGYVALRPLDIKLIPLFMLLRSLTYVGWIIPRMAEPGADQRLRRFVATAAKLSQAYIA
ncbi:MAG: phosphotransferase enzyme family protein [Pikeienuella sp.]